MSYLYRLRHEASKEFTEAYIWYEEKSDGLGERFILAIKEKLKLICSNPLHYKRSYRNFHEAVVDVFPFVIIYFIDETNGLIIVTAIFHTSRNPKGKFKKVRLK